MGAISLGAGIMYALLFVSLYFEVFLLVSFLEKRRERKSNNSTPLPADLPHVAVVVPCFNERHGIGSTITSLLALDYPKEKLEIIVVDDGSTDDTLAIARQFESRPEGRNVFGEDLVRSVASPADENVSPLRTNVRVFYKENGGKHSAMNFALERTNAEFIGCLDADSVVDQSALKEMVPVFNNPKVAAVTPGVHVRNPQTFLQHIQNVEYQLSIFNRFIYAGLGSLFITPGPFSFFRTAVVRELGGWRYGHSTEDMEIALRIQSVGHLIANAPRAIVHTTTPRTLPHLFHQRVRWTYGWLRNAVDYRFMVGNRAFGNLGLIILPSALISIATGIFFFFRVLWYGTLTLIHEYTRVSIMGVQPSMNYDLFYMDTSVILFLGWMSVALIFLLICIGSFIGTGRRKPPASTPLFLIFYSFLAPLWLSAALVRAFFKTGVRWR